MTLRPKVVKSARDLIQRIARVMLEVDVLPDQNGYYVENNNKQVFKWLCANLLLIYSAFTSHHFDLAVFKYIEHLYRYCVFNQTQAEVEAYMSGVGFKKVMWQVCNIFWSSLFAPFSFWLRSAIPTNTSLNHHFCQPARMAVKKQTSNLLIRDFQGACQLALLWKASVLILVAPTFMLCNKDCSFLRTAMRIFACTVSQTD